MIDLEKLPPLSSVNKLSCKVPVSNSLVLFDLMHHHNRVRAWSWKVFKSMMALVTIICLVKNLLLRAEKISRVINL